jgi:hypothetical protein
MSKKKGEKLVFSLSLGKEIDGNKQQVEGERRGPEP